MKFLVNGEQKELVYKFDGNDNTKGMIEEYGKLVTDENGNYVMSPEEYEWWKKEFIKEEQADDLYLNLDLTFEEFKQYSKDTESPDLSEHTRLQLEWLQNFERKLPLMEPTGNTVIKRMYRNKEVWTELDLTEEQYKGVLEKYTKENGWSDEFSTHMETFKEAEAQAPEGMELKKENTVHVDMGGFQQTVVIMRKWMEMLENAMFRPSHERLHIVIDYDVKMLKTAIRIYTPKEDASDDTPQESRKDGKGSFSES